ncbi:cysteine desulfurase [Corynebacterium sp. TAE3-ERU12]|uniref:cysteine desulfurase family protein n=1 Tax=Corynebacterium sp. TAE3-ERU12 TaxID=2849491 RepID=UPI001C445C69|nr:cysteine desulfurase family protein [Corynebacterium sp. TAE3-ERU12]MBV7295128.1 cysteine desulfurase [Corynebacterium sp. TAE3-ERU12]
MQHSAHLLDYAATAPLRPEAKAALVAALDADYGNPSGHYASGRVAKRALEEARETIAGHLGCQPIEVIFTSGGTEADNLGIRGLYALRNKDTPRPAIAAAAIEHDAVGHAIAATGAELIELPVTPQGRVDEDAARDLIAAHADRLALVSCMWANNETGAIQPVAAVAEAARDAGVPVHIDAVQAVGCEDVNFAASGAATLAVSAHKFGGPRGIGALIVRRDMKLEALLRGGGQERGLRSGTPDVASAVGMAAAVAACRAHGEQEHVRVARLRDQLRDGIVQRVENVVVHTSEPALPGHVHVSFPGAEGDSLLMLFDAAGVGCSTGSACSVGVNRPSHVLLAMGVDEMVARGAIRFSLGWASTQADVDAVLACVSDTVQRARAAGMA